MRSTNLQTIGARIVWFWPSFCSAV